MSKMTVAAALAAAFAIASPAAAQDSSLPDPNDRSDTFTLGLGGAIIPDYEGSDDYRIIPAAAIRGRVAGMSFSSRGTYLYLDVVPRGSGKLDFDLGPIAGVRLNRTGKIKDDVVDRLPERNKAIELGAFAGVTLHGLTNPYDALSFRVDYVKGFGNAHDSSIVTPTIDFGTPLSRTLYVGTSLSGDWVGGGYADYYYSIDLDDSIDSGLPTYNAKGGFKGWKASLLANQSLTGDLTHGLSLFGTGAYGHLSNRVGDSPIVDDRGSRGQWMGALGLAYTW